MDEPPANHRCLALRKRAIGTPAFDDERHEAEAPAPVLAAQLRKRLAVLVIDGVARLGDDASPAAEQTERERSPEPALEKLRELDPDALTPRQALEALYALKELLRE